MDIIRSTFCYLIFVYGSFSLNIVLTCKSWLMDIDKYTRASASYMRRLGWEESMVNASYKWVEKKVAFEPPVLQWQNALKEGLLEVGVSPYNGFTYDHKYGTKAGGTIFDKDGHRHTAADLLEYADPQRTTVYLHATVVKILFGNISRNGKLI